MDVKYCKFKLPTRYLFLQIHTDTDMDELVTERIMERARNLISALTDQR